MKPKGQASLVKFRIFLPDHPSPPPPLINHLMHPSRRRRVESESEKEERLRLERQHSHEQQQQRTPYSDTRILDLVATDNAHAPSDMVSGQVMKTLSCICMCVYTFPALAQNFCKFIQTTCPGNLVVDFVVVCSSCFAFVI